MIFKIGTLVLCQFFLTSDPATIKMDDGNTIASKPRQIVGTIKAIYPNRKHVPRIQQGQVVVLKEDGIILEIDGKKPGWHSFFNSTACVPVDQNSKLAEAPVEQAKKEDISEKKIEENKEKVEQPKEIKPEEKSDLKEEKPPVDEPKDKKEESSVIKGVIKDVFNNF